jgi:hypothetical protein
MKGKAMIIKRILNSDDYSVLLEFQCEVCMEFSLRSKTWLNFKLSVPNSFAYGKMNLRDYFIGESLYGDFVYFRVEFATVGDPPGWRKLEGCARVMDRREVAHIYAKQICGDDV